MWSNVQKMIFDIMFMLNLTYFLLNIFLFKMPIWATGGFYTNTAFYTYTDYIENFKITWLSNNFLSQLEKWS